MRGRSLIVVLAAALAVLVVFAPSAFAKDENPTRDNPGGDGPKGLYYGVYIYKDDPSPSGDNGVVATPTAAATPTTIATSTPSATPTAASTSTAISTPSAASATPSATVMVGVSASPRASASALPSSGGMPLLSVAVGVSLVGAGIVAAMLVRRTS